MKTNNSPLSQVVLTALMLFLMMMLPTLSVNAEEGIRIEWTDSSIVGRGEIPGLTTGIEHDEPLEVEISTAGSFANLADAQQVTPNPTYAFSTGSTAGTAISVGGSPADANVAASRTHICATARAAFACYTKGGALVSPGVGFDARPYSAKEFFAKSGLAIATAFDGDTNNVAKDGRIVFDQFRRRFFMDFQTRESKGRLMIAVSKSEDPRDGWWTYADLVATDTANTHDYQKIGINATHFLVSNYMVNCVKQQDGTFDCTQKGTRHLMYSADDLAAGEPYKRGMWLSGSANSAAPCTHNTWTTDAFWVRRDNNTHATVWAMHESSVTYRQFVIQPSSAAVDGVQLGGSAVVYTNIGRSPQNCEFRSGKIVWVSNDGTTWSGQSQPNNAIRLVRLNVSKFFTKNKKVVVEIDRIYGRASNGDPPNAIFDYGWPAVSTNAKGDIVVGAVRSNSTIYPELRASVWFSGQPDISSSVSYQKSSSPLSQFHMAGASTDPSTDGVYIAQQYGATTPSWRMRIAKMLGTLYPDLIAIQTQAPAKIKRGRSAYVTVQIMNQGDKVMPVSFAELWLSSNKKINTNDLSLGTFLVPPVAPNQVATLNMFFKIPRRQLPGVYFVGVILDRTSAAIEYSEGNNKNPFKAGNHGNVPLIVR